MSQIPGPARTRLRQSRVDDSGESVPYVTADGADFRADYADSSSIQPTSNFLLTLGPARSNLRVNLRNCGSRGFAEALPREGRICFVARVAAVLTYKGEILVETH